MKCSKTLADAKITAFTGGDGVCVVDWALKTARAIRASSCGQGVFCRGGVQQLDLIITDIASGLGRENDLDLLREIAGAMVQFADCELSREGARMILDSIANFESDWVMHIKRKKCRTLRCNKLVRFYLDPVTCHGCGKCRIQLPAICAVGAVLGSEGEIHIIDPDKCVRCGNCEADCAAVKRVDPKGVAPKVPEKPVPVGSFSAGPAAGSGLGGGRPTGLGGGARRGRR